jgi:hypothetical protein
MQATEVRPQAVDLRYWDGLFITLAALHAVVLMAWPAAPVIAIGVWWNSNTIAHNFIHWPFFRSRLLNRLFSAYLSVLLGIPQALWRQRHLAHHAGVEWKLRIAPQLIIESSLVLCFWSILAFFDLRFFVATYLPGYFIGLALCGLQGYYEHARGPTSHYGWLYNLICFNDGYHAEHHANSAMHWSRLPERMERDARTSRWPPLLRWLDCLTLEALEKLVLRSPPLQRFVLRCHRRAFRELVPQLPPPNRVAIVGGGLFPRTALILRELLPDSQLTILEANRQNLEIARALLSGGVEFVNERYVAGEPSSFDLVVIPLSFTGNRMAIYRGLPSRAVIVHDWIWRRRGTSRIVSVFLLKRLNLVLR